MTRAAPSRRLRIALAQINPTVGDLAGNAETIRTRTAEAREAGSQLVVFPELCLTGYPPEDLLLKQHFLAGAGQALDELAGGVSGIVALVGFAERSASGAIHNSAAVLAEGAVAGCFRKTLLPNYGVFDERRYFEPGEGAALIELGGIGIGITICEDIWFPGPPASVEALSGAALIVNLSASPYHRGKPAEREELVRDRALENGAAFALCNSVGGQDELVFDGHSVVVDAAGETVARAAQFEEELLIAELPLAMATDGGGGVPPAPVEASLLAAIASPEPHGASPQARLADPLAPEEAEVYAALVLGLRDYVTKNGFGEVVLGLSGGIDSALVAMVATDALGPDRVHSVIMPSPHSSQETQSDARRIAANLGIEAHELRIEETMRAYEELLRPELGDPDDPAAGLTAENLQARIRGNLLMALSNRFGWLVLTTGNKSELSVGYATLYGDMAGGFAVIKDVPKTLVYRLVAHRNEAAGRELVPASVIEREPSAELRPDQRDQDSLPDYETLDRIIAEYVELDRGREQIIASGLDAAVVDDVLRMIDGAEYKRRQAPPGIRISPKAFGRDRRLPITNRFRG